MNDLHDRVAVVTGASGGIGRAIALELARQGCHLALAARRQERLESIAAEVRALGREALVLPTDVTVQSQVDRLVDLTLNHFGRLDIVVANAGVYYRCPVTRLQADLFRRSMEVNFFGELYLVLAALPHFIDQASGHIVLVASFDARKGIPPDSPYAAAKFALRGLGDVLRQELRGMGVVVTIVYPGRVDTEMIADLDVPRISAKAPPEQVARATVRAIQRDKAEVFLAASHRLLDLVATLAPGLADRLVARLGLAGSERPPAAV